METAFIILTGIATALSALIAVMKWRSRIRLKVYSYANRIMIHPSFQNSKGPYICVDVTNIGEQPITITSIVLYYYKNRWDHILDRAFLKKKKQWGMIIYQLFEEVPKKLDTSEQALFNINQDDKLLQMIGKTQLVYCGINHSMSNKAITKKVKINPEETRKLIKQYGNWDLS